MLGRVALSFCLLSPCYVPLLSRLLSERIALGVWLLRLVSLRFTPWICDAVDFSEIVWVEMEESDLWDGVEGRCLVVSEDLVSCASNGDAWE